MRIYEPKNRIDVITPKGEGIIWIITDYGHETYTIYTIIIIKLESYGNIPIVILLLNPI
jgi:hypothetical protein